MTKRTGLLSVLAVGILLTGCGQKSAEQRPAAECKPIAEYETYDTVIVDSLDDVPQDCPSILLTTHEMDAEDAYNYPNEEQLYYEYETLSFAGIPTLDCFAYIVVVPESGAELAFEQVTQRPLKRLGLNGIPMTDLDTVSQMQGLETLWMSGCDCKANFSGSFATLTDLQCYWTNIDKLGDIPKITTLQRLTLHGTSIHSIKGLEKLTNLSKLDLMDTDIYSLKPLRTMTQLTSLNISDMGSLTHRTVPDLRILSGMTNLKTLGLNDCRYGVKHPEALSALTSLEYFSAVDSKLDSVEPLQPLVRMRVLDLRANKIADLSPLTGMTELETLMLHNNLLAGIEPVTELKHLKCLTIGNNDIIDIAPVAELPELEYLSVYLCANLSDIKPLLQSKTLKKLDIRSTKVTDTEVIGKMRDLEKLDISGTKISDITFLEGLTKLRELGLSGLKIKDIVPLLGLSRLEKLDLSNTQVMDIEGISRLHELYELKLNSTNVESIEELKKMPSLQKVYLENCRRLDREEVEAYQAEMEERGGTVGTIYH
ncbi:MAG: hypothetical protein IJ906_04025 [Oscillospiraceae bacterium]|nr:hypothetical protein [Oscillospiraceae bacterium]